jgi:hypothetical protein
VFVCGSVWRWYLWHCICVALEVVFWAQLEIYELQEFPTLLSTPNPGMIVPAYSGGGIRGSKSPANAQDLV